MIALTLTRYEGPEAEPILDCVRLQLIGMKDLLNEVRPLKLASADSIMDAISMKVKFFKKSLVILKNFDFYENEVSIKKIQVESRDIELPHRGFIFPDRNVAIATEGAEVIEGEFANYLLDGNTTDYTYEKGFSRHIIGTVINNIKCVF